MAYASNETAGPKPLLIQGIAFAPFELPERLALGALVHKLVVTEKFGGGRSTMNVGAQPKPVTIRGQFVEFDKIDSNVQAITAIMVSGQEISISYGIQSWYAKIIDFTPDAAYLTTNYDITFELTRSANGTFGGSSPISVDSQNQSLASLALANSQNVLTLDPNATSLNANVSSLNSAVISTPLGTASSSSVSSLTAQVSQVLTQATTYAAPLSSTDARFLPANGVVDALTLLKTNIGNTETAASVSVTGGTMFDVAGQYCGDSSKAFAIMSANGIASPILSKLSTTLIYIPQSLRSTSVAA